MIIACSYCLLFAFSYFILHTPPCTISLLASIRENEKRSASANANAITSVCIYGLWCFAFHFGRRLISLDKSELGALICAKCVIKYRMCVSRLS